MKPLLSCQHEDSAVTTFEYALVANICLVDDQVALMYNDIEDQAVLALS